jgi:hypothetical protein|tara:strand:+ start:942 stop:1118 length:177 start_codon:yes stop_codon:yes gene_type:complete
MGHDALSRGHGDDDDRVEGKTTMGTRRERSRGVGGGERATLERILARGCDDDAKRGKD